MRDLKKYTSQKALHEYSKSGKVWQERYDRQAIWTERVLRTKIEYVHNNPIKAGLASDAHAWYWSSASDYLGRINGPVEVWKEWYF